MKGTFGDDVPTLKGEVARLADEVARLRQRNVNLDHAIRLFVSADGHMREAAPLHSEIELLLLGEPPVPND